MIVFAWILLLSGLSISSIAVSGMEDFEEISEVFRNFLDSYFLGGLGLIVVSIFMRRFAVAFKKSASDSAESSDFSVMQRNIQEVISSLETLKGLRSSINLKEVAEKIDELLSNQIFDIVEGRGAIIAKVGYGSYGTFMSDFATGERCIARTWSASIDGHEEEAFAYVERSIPFFTSAQKKFDNMMVNS